MATTHYEFVGEVPLDILCGICMVSHLSLSLLGPGQFVLLALLSVLGAYL